MVLSAYPTKFLQGIHMLNIDGYLHPLSRNKGVHILKYKRDLINHECICGEMSGISNHSLYTITISVALELKERGVIVTIMNAYGFKG